MAGARFRKLHAAVSTTILERLCRLLVFATFRRINNRAAHFNQFAEK